MKKSKFSEEQIVRILKVPTPLSLIIRNNRS